jgi:molecular chaperone GrpE
MNDDRTNPNSNAATNVESCTTSAEQTEDSLLEQLRADLEAAKDRVLRSQAELENFRKRASREIEENRRYAELPLIQDLLPVLDNVERAIDAADKAQDVAVLLEGIKLVARQFEEVLARHHCQRIGALHLPFDPHLHHAISQQPTNEYPANTVVIVAQSGFQLYDRVVRPSQVIVSRLPDAEAAK